MAKLFSTRQRWYDWWIRKKKGVLGKIQIEIRNRWLPLQEISVSILCIFCIFLNEYCSQIIIRPIQGKIFISTVNKL